MVHEELTRSGNRAALSDPVEPIGEGRDFLRRRVKRAEETARRVSNTIRPMSLHAYPRNRCE